MKKIVYIFYVLLLSLIMISCGSKEEKKEAVVSNSITTQKEESSNVTKNKPKELKISTFTTNDNYIRAKWVYGPEKKE